MQSNEQRMLKKNIALLRYQQKFIELERLITISQTKLEFCVLDVVTIFVNSLFAIELLTIVDLIK